MDGSRTKKAEVIEYVLKNCKVEDRQSVLMVGDREHDILGAKACKVSALGVLYGYGDRAELEDAGADWIDLYLLPDMVSSDDQTGNAGGPCRNPDFLPAVFYWSDDVFLRYDIQYQKSEVGSLL